jgi:hypothetical protein
LFIAKDSDMTVSQKTVRNIRVLALALAAACLLVAIWKGWSFQATNNDLLQTAVSNAQQSLKATQSEINGSLQQIADGVDSMAAEVSSVDPSERHSIEQLLGKLLMSDPGYVETGVVFAPFEYQHSIRLYGLALRITADGVQKIDLDATSDYAKEMPEWYRVPISGTAHWSSPDYDDRGIAAGVRYSTPIYGGSGESADPVPIGALYATFDADTFSRLLGRIDLGSNGYAFLLSGAGRYFVHPNLDFIGREFSLQDRPSAGLSRDGGSGLTGLLKSNERVRIVDSTIDMAGSVFLSGIEDVEWTLGNVIFDRDYHLAVDVARHSAIHIRLLIGSAIFFLAIAIIGFDKGNRVRGWTLSWTFSAICIVLYWLIVQASITSSAIQPEGRQIITRPHDLHTFKLRHSRRTLADGQRLPIFIPTGIYLHSMNFMGPTDLRITGLVWQRYTDGIHDDISRGFIMPASASFEAERAYSWRIGNQEAIGWNFKATLSEALEYSGYPFGRETISIQLWHKQFYRDVVLVPDLDGYKDVRPYVKPGLVHGLSVLGWSVDSTFFSFSNQSYDTNFGIVDQARLTDVPELFFSVQLQKQIISPFVSNILPLSVVLILLFALLVLGASRQRSQKSGIALNAVAAGAGLFLLVIFSHINLRANLAAREIFYLEYYYFLVYLVILGVTVNYLLFTKTEIPMVNYRGNLVAKVLYWPLTQFTILAFTLAEFY